MEEKPTSVGFADRWVVLPARWNSFLKSLLCLQHPAEHLPVVKIKGCWTQDFTLLLLPKACKEQLMESSLVNTPSHTSTPLLLNPACLWPRAARVTTSAIPVRPRWWVPTPPKPTHPPLFQRAGEQDTAPQTQRWTPARSGRPFPGTAIDLPSHAQLRGGWERGLTAGCCLLPRSGRWLLNVRLKAALV